MKKLLVVIAALLCLLPITASAYVIQANIDGWDGPSSSFGTGSEISTPLQPDQRVGAVDPSRDLVRGQFFVMQDPGTWHIQAFPVQPGGFGTTVRLWVTNLGTEGPSNQVWRAHDGWGNELWSGTLLAQTTTAMNPTATIFFDFGINPDFILEAVVPEPASIAALLSGLAGFACFRVRRMR